MPDIMRLYIVVCLLGHKTEAFLKFTNGKSIEFIDDL